MPWATVRVEDRDNRRGSARRGHAEAEQAFFDAHNDQGKFWGLQKNAKSTRTNYLLLSPHIRIFEELSIVFLEI